MFKPTQRRRSTGQKNDACISVVNGRCFRRFGLRLACRVRLRKPDSGSPAAEFLVETQNVSRGGLYFIASTPWIVGSSLDFELEVPAAIFAVAAKIRCRGRVVRVIPQDGGRTGVGATIDYSKIVAISPSVMNVSSAPQPLAAPAA